MLFFLGTVRLDAFTHTLLSINDADYLDQLLGTLIHYIEDKNSSEIEVPEEEVMQVFIYLNQINFFNY